MLEIALQTLRKCKPSEFRKSYGLWDREPLEWEEDKIFLMKGSHAHYNPIFYSYVLYEKKRLTVGRFLFQIGLSFNFSGCLMASFKYKGYEYISHIPVDGSNCRQQFQEFIYNNCFNPGDFNIFKPFFEPLCCSYWGLITKTGKCYSIGINTITDEIVKIEEATPMSYDDKINLLLNNIDLERYIWD